MSILQKPREKYARSRIVSRFLQVPLVVSDNVFFVRPTSSLLYSTSFVKTNALGGLLASGTAVLTDFFENSPQQLKN